MKDSTITGPYADFFDAYVRCFGPLVTVQTARTPPEMVIGPDRRSRGWVQWRLLPCDVDLEPRFLELEHRCGHAFPATFKRWYSSCFTLDMDLSVVRLPANPSNAPLVPLAEIALGSSVHSARPLELGLLPFGDEAMMDAGPICFDTRDGGAPDNWPIRYWDHEYNSTPEEVGPVIFSSFGKLTECCTKYMLCFAAVRERLPDASDEWLDHRGECIRAMMEADPSGAGGPGREYWGQFLED